MTTATPPSADPFTVEFSRAPSGHFLLTTSLWLPRPIDEVFAFFADAPNLDALTPPFLP